jgi:D-2-hydroxyacid dehydrogenase (NADP+)
MKIVITRNFDPKYLEIIREATNAEVLASERQAEIEFQIKDADILFWCWHKGHDVANILRAAKKLAWIHCLSAGVDQVLCHGIIDSKTLLTRSATTQNIAIAEHCLALMLCLSRRINTLLLNQTKRYWERLTGDELFEHTAVIIGIGAIGREVAKRCKGFGMKVIGVDLKEPQESQCDMFIPVDQMHRALREADYLIVCLPLTSATKGLIGSKEFEALKDGAALINTSRGGIVVESEMIKALKNKKLKAAGCDVFEKEPLPATSELYDMDNVIITTHMAGQSPYMTKRAVDLFCTNYKKFIHGEPLLYLADKGKGF